MSPSLFDEVRTEVARRLYGKIDEINHAAAHVAAERQAAASSADWAMECLVKELARMALKEIGE